MVIFKFFKSIFCTRKRVPRGYQKSLQYFYRNREKIFFEKYLPKITQGGYQKRWFIFVELIVERKYYAANCLGVLLVIKSLLYAYYIAFYSTNKATFRGIYAYFLITINKLSTISNISSPYEATKSHKNSSCCMSILILYEKQAQ